MADYFPWNVLEIEPTGDEKVIKRAYAAKLKVTRPDENPEGFQRLREALDSAKREAEWIREDEEADEPWEDEAADEASEPITGAEIEETTTRDPIITVNETAKVANVLVRESSPATDQNHSLFAGNAVGDEKSEDDDVEIIRAPEYHFHDEHDDAAPAASEAEHQIYDFFDKALGSTFNPLGAFRAWAPILDLISDLDFDAKMRVERALIVKLTQSAGPGLGDAFISPDHVRLWRALDDLFDWKTDPSPVVDNASWRGATSIEGAPANQILLPLSRIPFGADDGTAIPAMRRDLPEHEDSAQETSGGSLVGKIFWGFMALVVVLIVIRGFIAAFEGPAPQRPAPTEALRLIEELRNEKLRTDRPADETRDEMIARIIKKLQREKEAETTE